MKTQAHKWINCFLLVSVCCLSCGEEDYEIEQKVKKGVNKQYNLMRDSLRKEMDSLCSVYQEAQLQSLVDSLRKAEWEKIKTIILNNAGDPQ